MFNNLPKILTVLACLLAIKPAISGAPDLLNSADRHKLAGMISNEKDKWQLLSSEGIEFHWNNNNYELFANASGGKFLYFCTAAQEVRVDIDLGQCFEELKYTQWSPSKVLENKGDILDSVDGPFTFDANPPLVGLNTSGNISVAWVYFSVPDKAVKYLSVDEPKRNIKLPFFAFNIRKVENSSFCSVQ